MKRILGTLVLIAWASLSNAQYGMMVGARMAVGASYYTPQNNYGLFNRELDYKFNPGYNAGMRFGFGINKFHALLGEFNYNKQGQQYHDQFSTGRNKPKETIDKDIDLNYMGGAIMYRFSPLTKNQKTKKYKDIKGRLYLMGGVGINKLLSADVVYFRNEVVDNAYPTNATYGYAGVTEDKDLFMPIDVNLLAEVGGEIFVNKTKNFAIEPAFRMQFGLNDQNAKAFRIHDAYNASRNLFFGLQVGFIYFFESEVKK
jgi:hypothetical protein